MTWFVGLACIYITTCGSLRRPQQSDLRHVRQHHRTVAAATAEPVQEQQPEQPAVEQRSVKLRKPVGVIFAQNKGGPVYVEELTAGGNADKIGVVQVGQQATKLISQPQRSVYSMSSDMHSAGWCLEHTVLQHFAAATLCQAARLYISSA